MEQWVDLSLELSQLRIRQARQRVVG
jgi:hypothetical protein